MRSKFRFKALASVHIAALSSISAAQMVVAPDAGTVRQQIERQRELPLPSAVRPERVAPPVELKPLTGMTVVVKEFRFSGNALLGAEQLAPAVAGFLNRPLDFSELQRAADAVAAAYRKAGWIVRAYLPEQDISAGLVTLQVVEAVYGGLRFEGVLPRRVMPAELEANFNARQAVGQPLNATALDRALLLADDLPGVSVAGTLVPGQADGETALVLNTTDEPLLYGDIGLDNTGGRSTGSHRLAVNMNLNSPGGRGELVNLNLLLTEGSNYGRLSLTVPAGHDGLRLGVNASSMNYKVIDGPGQDSAAQIRGRSGSLGLDLSYPLVRARMHNLYLSAGFENKNFYNQDTQVRSDYESAGLRVGLSGNLFDDFGGGGANSATAQWSRGRLVSMEQHPLLDSIDRNYNKLTYSVSRQQGLNAQHSLFFSVSGQRATQLLDSSEKFFLGGANSVRAYPVSELGGERGHVFSGEWRWRLKPTLVMTAFADLGEVVVLAATPSDRDTPMRLRGHGLSFAWQGPAGLTARLTWSHRRGSNPRPTLAGTDGDGTLKKHRLWFTVGMPF